jgi:hypothetical protein
MDFVAGGKLLACLFVFEQPETQLADIVHALDSPSTLPRRLYGGQEHCH